MIPMLSRLTRTPLEVETALTGWQETFQHLERRPMKQNIGQSATTGLWPTEDVFTVFWVL